MKKPLIFALVCALASSFFLGCSNAGPRKYVFFGDPQPEKVEMFEDYWEDYPFRPDDSSLPLRRGKGGVIRFFKKGSYTKSILVDGELTVNVYYSQREGVTLTQPDAQMILTSEELNKKHRKFNKDVGYTYHVYLDLGEYDQPEEEITILSVFRDAKTNQATLSKEIRTTTLGTSPPVPKEKERVETDAEKIARRLLGSDEEIENPIAELQARYSVRSKAKEDKLEATKDTRLRNTIDLSDSKFEDIEPTGTAKSVSYLEESQRNRNEAFKRLIDENLEKEEYYREKRRQEADRVREDRDDAKTNISSLRDAPTPSSPMNFNGIRTPYVDLQQATSQNYESLANQFSERAKEEYAKRANATESSKESPYLKDAASFENAETTYANERGVRDRIYGDPLTNGYERAKPVRPSEEALKKTSELDSLDDLVPDSSAPPTEIYVKKI